MEILIIGGSRFVGPLIIELLIKKGHKVTVFNRGHAKTDYKEAKFIKGDRNRGFQIKEKFDIAIDMCAYAGSHTKTAIEQLNFDFFIHMSSAAAYKKTESFPLDESSPLGEWPLWSEYNKGKVECERVLEKSNLNYASIRPVYILGPKNYANRESFIYSRLGNEQPITLPGNGEAIVQFVFAKDVAKSIVTIAEKKECGAFNCSGDEMTTLKGLLQEMGSIIGKKPIIDYDTSKDGELFDESDFPFANENFICSNKKIKELGINFTPLIKGMKEDYVNYYSKLM